MSYSEYLAQKDWICNNPTEDEIRFNDDSDVISSDDSDVEKSKSSKLKKYNQLLPTGRFVHKLLHSTKPKSNKSWRTADSALDFHNEYTGDKSGFNHHSTFFSSDDSDSDERHSSVVEESNQSSCTAKSIDKFLNSTRSKGNKTWKTVESKVDLQEKDTESELETVSSERMAKSHKRKREASASDTEEASSLKKIKTNENKSVGKKVKRKENSHNVSCSESENSEGNSTRIKSKGHESKSVGKKVKSKENSHNPSCSESEDSEGNSTRIKSKGHESKSVGKKVKRKENSHSVSCSESEDSEGNSTRTKSKRHKSLNKPDKNLLNTHLLSSETDNEADQSYDFTSSNITSRKTASENGEVTDSEHESVENSEEEINNVTVTSNTSDSRKKLHRIPKLTPELNEEISKFSMLLDENLIEKNDIWILQCPSNMDCSALVSQRLSLGGSCQLNDGERTYETYSYRNTHARSATLAVPSEHNRLNLRRIPISGNIIVEESVKAVNNVRPSEIILEPPSRVEFPENLRVRHPLLGVDFSTQPRTAERVAESLPKKKKRSKKHGESYNGLTLSDIDPPSIPIAIKKKKKSKGTSSEDLTISGLSGQLLEESVDEIAVKKKKKKKHKDNDSFN